MVHGRRILTLKRHSLQIYVADHVKQARFCGAAVHPESAESLAYAGSHEKLLSHAHKTVEILASLKAVQEAGVPLL